MKRISEFDFVRILAAAAVVYIHSAYTAVSRLQSGDVWGPLFLTHNYSFFAVPAFIFITGALVWTHPPDSGSRAYGQFLVHRLRVVVPAYLVWSAVFWFITYSGYGWSKPGTGGAAGIIGFLWQVLTGTAWMHLYFVPIIICVYALTPLAARVIGRSRVGALVLSVGLAMIMILVWPVVAVDAPGIEVVIRLISFLPYAVCGAWYALRHTENDEVTWVRSGWPGLLLGGLALQTLYVTGTLGTWPAPVAYAVRFVWVVAIILGLMGGCAELARRYAITLSPARVLASLTYWVFLIHPALLVVFYRISRSAGMPAVWSDPRYVILKWSFAFFCAFACAACYRWCTSRVRMRT